MAEELKRHGITFSLDLNKHPKDATNLSLINAENFKISEDGASLISDKSLLENEIIKNKLNEYYKNIHFNIIHCISTNDEIVLFIASNYIEDSYYDLDLFRYSEKLDTCSDSIIPSEYEKMKYYGGKFSGTFTYNVKNELIITFCEYDSVLPTEFECGEPMKIINLGYWEKFENEEYKLINNSNLNPKTFPICPEVTIPQMINDKIISGYSKKGWYHFYIRYKINNNDYTQWFDFGKSFYLDEFKNNNLFNYHYDNLDINLNIKISDTYEICNKTIEFELLNLSNIYKYYQIGFICNTKTYNNCKITKDINIKNTKFILNYFTVDDYDVNNLIKNYSNYYNVKNIINYNNRLYISNFLINKNIVLNTNIEYKIKKEELELSNEYITINRNDETITIYSNEINIKNIINTNNVYEYNNKINKTETYNDIRNLSALKPIVENILNNNNDTKYILITNLYASGPNYNNPNKNRTIDIKVDNGTILTEISRNTLNFANNRLKTIKLSYIEFNNLTDISNYDYNIEDSKYLISNYNFDGTKILYGDFKNLNELSYELLKNYLILNADIKEDYQFTLLPYQPYMFYIHYVDKYGNFTDGININNNLNIYNNESYISIYKWNTGTAPLKRLNLYYKADEKLFLSNIKLNQNLNNLINVNNCYISIISNNRESIISDTDTIISYIDTLDTTKFYTLFDYMLDNDLMNYSCGELKMFVELYNIPDTIFNITNDTYINYYNKNQQGILLKYEGEYKYKIEFDNIILPNNYVSYFITYEKLEKTLLHQGYYDYNKLYNDNLNYKDSIALNINNDETFKIITNVKYNIANAFIDNNYGKSTNIEIIDDDDSESKIKYFYSNIFNKYLNKNKILIRVTEISNKISISSYTYSFLSENSAIVINNNYRINNLNRLINDSQELITDSPISIEIRTLYGYIVEQSKQINNPPKIYKTIINDVKYDEPTAQFYDSYLFLPYDTIDLFKNNALDYDESVLSIYTNYNENNINQTNFIKTIRRSTYIKDESLENGWRTFESEAYQNIQENKGEITRIEGIGDLLLVHTKDSLFQFDKSNLLMTANKNVQLAQGDTFDVGYKEIFTSTNGFGGLQDKEAAIVGEFGYIWYNNDFNKIYQYNAGSLNVISGNIEFLLNKYKPTKCKFVDDKYNKRLLIQFQLNNDQVLNLTYNYDIKAFISFYINDESESALMNEVYNTKTKFYILENNKIFSGFNKPNAKKLSFIINENYTKIKRLNYIKYKLYKRIDSSNNNFNADVPVEGMNFVSHIIENINYKVPYSGYKLKVYNDLCETELLDIIADLNNKNPEKPYYDLGNFIFNNLRDKTTNNQIFGNFFIVEFSFEDNQEDIIEFESLEYGISYEEN